MGEDSDRGRGHGKQRGKGPQVVPAFVSVLYPVTQEAKLPNPPAQGKAQGADGKVSPDQSLRRSPERRSRMRRQHLTHIKHTTGYQHRAVNQYQQSKLSAQKSKINQTSTYHIGPNITQYFFCGVVLYSRT